MVLTKDWYHNPDDVLARIEKLLQGQEAADEVTSDSDEQEELPAPVASEPPVTVALPPTLPIEPNTPTTATTFPASNPDTGSVRRFEFVGGSSQKFWEISVSGNSFAVRFGRIGTAGQSQTKTFADEAKAKREAENLIVEKVKKGYVENDR